MYNRIQLSNTHGYLEIIDPVIITGGRLQSILLCRSYFNRFKEAFVFSISLFQPSMRRSWAAEASTLFLRYPAFDEGLEALFIKSA